MVRDSLGFAYPPGSDKRFEITPPQFTAGGVFFTSIRVLIRNLAPFGIITALIGIPYIVMVAAGFAPSPFQYRMSGTQFGISMPGIVFNSTPLGVVLGLTYIVTQCAINYGTFQSLCGKKVAVGECLSRGLGGMVKVVLAGILMFIVVGLVVAALVLLSFSVPATGFVILPATALGLFVLYVMWWVVVPVIVVEGGFIGCFARSRKLTKGNRWGIVGLLLMAFAAEIVLSLAIAGLGFAFGPMVGEVFGMAVALISFAFAGVLTAVGYYRLREEREGISTEDLARVFD
jgi:hypothetical protein